MKKLVCRYVCSVLMVLSLFGLTAPLNGIVYTVGKEIVYSNGPHGLSTGDASIEDNPFCDRYPRWVEDSVAWLADVLGGITPKGLAAPRFGAKVNGNRERTLNLDCTLAHLMGNPAAKALLDGAVPGWDSDAPSGRATVIRLGDTLRYMGLDERGIRAIEEKLNAIDNRSEEA